MLQPIRLFVQSLEQKAFYQYAAGLLGVIALLSGLLVYRHYRTMSALRQSAKVLNHQRYQAQKLLTKRELVHRQQDAVDSLLEKDPAFKIREYFEKLIEQLNVKEFAREITAAESEIEINPQYKELTVDVRFKGLTMKQVSELIAALEQKERIYLKELSIDKSKDAAVVSVHMILATLQRRPEAGAEQTE